MIGMMRRMVLKKLMRGGLGWGELGLWSGGRGLIGV
jgi:hypothetical protein